MKTIVKAFTIDYSRFSQTCLGYFLVEEENIERKSDTRYWFKGNYQEKIQLCKKIQQGKRNKHSCRLSCVLQNDRRRDECPNYECRRTY